MLGRPAPKPKAGWVSVSNRKDLTELRDTASQLLSELGRKLSVLSRRGGRVCKTLQLRMVRSSAARAPPGSGEEEATMSAAARAAIRGAESAWAQAEAG